MTSNEVSNDVSNADNSDVSCWDKAIVDAEDELKSLRQKAVRLKRAIQIFRENIRDGVRWPMDGTKP